MTQQTTDNRKEAVGNERRIYIEDMNRQIKISIDEGCYYTAKNQLRDLMSYIKG